MFVVLCYYATFCPKYSDKLSALKFIVDSFRGFIIRPNRTNCPPHQAWRGFFPQNFGTLCRQIVDKLSVSKKFRGLRPLIRIPLPRTYIPATADRKSVGQVRGASSVSRLAYDWPLSPCLRLVPTGLVAGTEQEPYCAAVIIRSQGWTLGMSEREPGIPIQPLSGHA